MKKNIYVLSLFLLINGISYRVNAQQSTKVYEDSSRENKLLRTSFEELRNIKKVTDELSTSIASSAAKLSLLESPAAVTLITEEDIQKCGCRDILEVLEQVPGLQGATDVGHARSVGVRGLVTSENRILFLIDGHQMNETTYGFVPMTGRIPLEIIEKIEIIRGPGSARYGGSAGLAVISITTKNESKEKGVKVSHSQELSNRFSNTSSDIYLGHSFDNGLDVSIVAGYKQGSISNRDIYFSNDSVTEDFRNTTGVNNTIVGLSASYRDIKLKYMYEKYELKSSPIANFGSGSYLFGGNYLGAEYDRKIQKHNLNSFIYFKAIESFNTTDVPLVNTDQYKTIGGINWSLEIVKNVSVAAGLDAYTLYSKYRNKDIGTVQRRTYSISNPGDSSALTNNNLGFYGEVLWKTKYVNILAGGRFDYNDAIGFAFVPRLTLTKELGRFHYKILFNQSFKTSVIGQIAYPDTVGREIGNIKPENITVGEIEVGYAIGPKFLLNTNIFFIHLDNTVIVTRTEALPNGAVNFYYSNQGSLGSLGLELSLRYVSRYVLITGTYSFYRPTVRNVNPYIINDTESGYEDKFLAYSPHFATLNVNVRVTKDISTNINTKFYGERAYYLDNIRFEKVYIQQKPTPLFNIGVNVNHFLLYKVTLSASINNILNTDFRYGVHINNLGARQDSPINGRTFQLKLIYKL